MIHLLDQLSWKLADKTGLSDDTSYYVIIAIAIAFVVGIVALGILADYLAERRALPMSFEKARRKLSPTSIFWAGQWLPDDIQKYHFAITGTTRSGKSLFLLLYLRSIVSQIRPGSDRRLILFDPKNVLHTRLFEHVDVPVYYLLPSDQRSCRWDLARDFNNPAAIKQFCHAVVPDGSAGADRFFTDAVRELMIGIITSLNITQRGKWDLADVVRIMESTVYTTEVLERTADTRSKLQFLSNQKTWASIQATVQTRLNDLRILAALWSRAGTTFSLTDFVHGEGILVLGRDPRYAELLDPVNMLLLTQLFSQVLAQDDSDTRRTHLVIDELTVAAGENRALPGFKDICERGAARGVVVVAAYQSYPDVKALYQEGGDAILGMLQNQVFLRAGDAATAKYASEAFGRRGGWGVEPNPDPGSATSLQPKSLTVSSHEDAVPYEQFLGILPASPKRGITGYRLSAEVRAARPFNLRGYWIAENLPKSSEEVREYLPRRNAHQYLAPFSHGDLVRLKLSIPARTSAARAAPMAVLPKAPAALPPPPAGDDITGRLRRRIKRPGGTDDGPAT